MKHLRMSVKPFERSDLKQMVLLEDEQGEVLSAVDLLESLTKSGSERAFAGVVKWDDVPLVMGGWCEVAPGTVQLFIAPDMNYRLFKKAFHRAIKIFLRYVMRFDWCERVQTFSLPTPRIDAWMQALGFHCEGTVNSYTKAGAQYKLWSRSKVDGIWQSN